MEDQGNVPMTMKPQTVIINERRELYRCYMPFIKGGGLFIPFNEEINASKVQPGQKVFIVLSILDSKQKIPIHGKIVWISRGGPMKGYGVALGESPVMKSLKETIETHIAEIAAKKENTYTL